MIPRKTIVLLAVSTSIFFEALDIAIVNLAIPLIREDFHLSAESVQWIQTLYVLFYGGFLIIGGKLADLAGRKKTFMIGSLLFLLTSLGAALSTSIEMLCVFRSIQGLGAALVMPSAFSIVTNAYQDPAERNKALGVFGSFAAIGSGSGLSLGGLIATYLGWQWVFYINVPVIGLSLLFSYIYIQPDAKVEDKKTADYLTGILLTLSMLMLTYLVHEIKNFQKDFILILLMILAVITFVWIIAKRRKHENALIDFSLFNTVSTRTANGIMFLMGAFFTGYLFMISMVFQSYMHYTAATAGLLLFPFSILSAIVSKSVLPRLLRKISIVSGGTLGAALMTMGGVMLLLAINFEYHLAFVLASVACVTGTGISFCFLTMNVLAIREIPESQHGLASSFVTTSFFFGGGLGLSILSVFLNSDVDPVIPVVILTLYALPGVIWLLVGRRSF